MNIDKQLLKFPRTLPNDLEAFMVFYPNKFPPIVSYFEKVARQVATDPKAYQEYGNWAHDELFAGFKKIKEDYDNGNQEDLSFLVETDQRLHKLFCYRFWPVNYLFADGPLHEFFVTNLKNFIRKLIDVADEVEEFEGKIIRLQRDLLQSDYADLYLRQALEGVEIVKSLAKNPKTRILFERAINLINQGSDNNLDKINAIWFKVLGVIRDKKTGFKKLREMLTISLTQAEMRGNMSPAYNMLTHAVEFRKENENLAKRNKEVKHRINSVMLEAKDKLSPEEYELFDLSYQQARNFSMYKDVMGEIDILLLPLWFGLHDKMRAILSKDQDLKPRITGHSAVFYYFVWYLPPELKAKVMSPDKKSFSLDKL